MAGFNPARLTSPGPSSGNEQAKPRSRWLTWNHNFDVDHYLNLFLPSGPQLLRRLPKPVHRFLGHRDKMEAEKDSDLVVWLWAFLGAFAGVAVIENVFMHWRFMAENGVPIIVGSYGAAAILIYNSVDSPLAQPRNAFGGQLVSSIVGVAITKLFMLSPHFETDLVWLAGALSCALASVMMGVTKTVHPPAGATALLAAVDSRTRDMGWLLIPVVVVSSVLMIAVGLLLGNVQRTYPRYWWTSGMVGKDLRESRRRRNSKGDVEKVAAAAVGKRSGETGASVLFPDILIVERDRIVVPEFIVLGDVERNVLEVLRGRIQEYHDDMEAERLSEIRGLTPQDTLR